MDSLTQIILGAAVGEIALGKKIGNRALVWGGIGGTIPDLDVLANGFMSSIDALAFHRSISHSILFSVVAPFLFAWLVHNLYDKKIHKKWPYKILISVINAAIIIALAYGINRLFMNDGKISWVVLIVSAVAGVFLLWRLYKYYLIKDLEEPQVKYREWYYLFFLALATHWLLDCFTAYGTQIFYPFSDFRVAFNNVAVVDPAYTVPFMICVIIVSTLKRGTRARKITNWLGIGISSLYMLFTLINKFHVDDVFDKALQNRKIEVSRCQCSPTILNNILWSCVADGKENFYMGQYSLFDSDPNLHYLNVLSKNDSIHQLLAPQEDYQTLLWFSKEYLTSTRTDSMIILSDLRFGSFADTVRGPEDLIFNFSVREVNGQYEFEDNGPPRQENMAEQLKKFMTRIKGY